MKFSNETLMAYADGELDAETRRAVEAEMASDPQVAQEVARHRALQSKLRSALDGVIHETVPDDLIAAARKSPAGARSQVTDLAAARAARQSPAKRAWSWPEWGAIAASLILGVIGGRAALLNGSDSLVAQDGRMVARGTLAAALDDQPSGMQAGAGKVHVGASFRAKSGNYCRIFTVGETSTMAGLACNDEGQWSVRAVAQSEGAASGEYRTASTSLPPSIAAAVEENMDGEALDADEEKAARSRGWKP